MQIIPIPYGEVTRYRHDWLQAILQCAETGWPGQNPLLPPFIAGVMHWPLLEIFVQSAQRPLAWIALLHTRHGWYSLPHFTTPACWLDTYALATALPGTDSSARYTLFFNRLLKQIPIQHHAGKAGSLLFELTEPGKLPPEAEQQPRLSGIRSPFVLLSQHGNHKTESLLNLSADAATTFAALPGGVRRKIGKASRNGVQVTAGGAELLPDFYRVYRSNIHHLGSFGLPYTFFKTLTTKYANGLLRVYVATLQGKPVGSAILISFGKAAENPWFATLRQHNSAYVSYLLHWQMMQDALAAGATLYSFGRSSNGSGVHRYKQQWGTFDRPVYYNSLQIAGPESKNKYLRKLVRALPQWLAASFDTIIAQHYY